MPSDPGKVVLVGAGPGDPSLLTLRGQQLLQKADVVLYDYLVNELVLSHAPPTAELVCLGRHGTGRMFSQSEVNEQMIAAAHLGKFVVRLKGGDPSVFGRVAEETAALEAAHVQYEVVPGVTAALAASSYTGIPLTHRDFASCVAFIAGQESREKDESSLDFEHLAKFPGTLVIYMGVTTAPAWATRLLRHGKPASTPVAIVRHGSLAQQQVVRTTLGDVPKVLAPGKMRPPAVILVGEVVDSPPAVDWFTSRPLFGRTLMVTRPEYQADDLIDRLAELGARALVQPAIRIVPVDDFSNIDASIARLPQFEWLVFSSANGVSHFLDRLLSTSNDLRRLGSCRIAAIGPATIAALDQYHLCADVMPDEYRAEALAAKLAPDAAGKRFLLLRASRGREVLGEALTAAGGKVEQLAVYQSNDVEQADPEVVDLLQTGSVDWITVTSSAIARSLVLLFGDQLHQTKLAAISPLTASVLSEAGYSPTVVATEYTTRGLLEAVLDSEQKD